MAKTTFSPLLRARRWSLMLRLSFGSLAGADPDLALALKSWTGLIETWARTSVMIGFCNRVFRWTADASSGFSASLPSDRLRA